MSGSEPGEMAPESSQTVVMPKFDMHIYTSTLTAKELKEVVTEYCIPSDLHPRLPPLSNYNGYAFGLVHVSQLVPMGVNRVILFEIRCQSLNINAIVSLFRVFYKLYLRAIPDAMPWRPIDTDVRDDFPMNYNEGDAERLAETVVPVRPPPRHLLCLRVDHGLPPFGAIVLNKGFNCQGNQCGWLLSSLPIWTETTVSKGDPLPNDERPVNRTISPLAVGQPIHDKTTAQKNVKNPNTKIAEAREKKEKLAQAKIQLKCAGGDGSMDP
ncbi:hypothetical protein Tco_0729241 [Tanacetum coccineum]|uniref:Uncharacterized protein n=1 Tax=Tanacetum coccineum TaxID=301880 RepID=A0ABQ4YQS6_9ASTR